MLPALARFLEANGVDLTALGLAFARVAPVVAIVPAFGLRAMSPALRAAVAVLLASAILPALRPSVAGVSAAPALLVLELARGTVVAVAAAVPLYVAAMSGGVVDALRGSQDLVAMPTVEGRATSLGVLFSLLASALFLGMGGPARILATLATGSIDVAHGAARVAADLAAGVQIAVTLAAPLLAASIVVEIAGALVARAASPAHLHALLAPVRSLLLLALTALLFDRLARFLALLVGG
jgi:type III secretory pathway component EscT